MLLIWISRFVRNGQTSQKVFVFLLVMQCNLILLVNGQKGHMCLRQLCSALWDRWNQKVSLTEWVTRPHIGLMSWTAKKDLFVNIREDSIQGKLPPVDMKGWLVLFVAGKKTTTRCHRFFASILRKPCPALKMSESWISFNSDLFQATVQYVSL